MRFRLTSAWPSLQGAGSVPAAPARDASANTRRVSWRAVPVGQVIKIRDGDVRREVLVAAYVQSAGGARFIVAEWPFGPVTFTAADDRGVSYQVSWRGEMASRELLLRPDRRARSAGLT